MVAFRSIRRLRDLEDFPVLAPGETITVDATGKPVVASVGASGRGADGAPGAHGAKGDPGTTWLTGSGAPDNATGTDNDLYLDTDTGDVFKKGNGSWL